LTLLYLDFVSVFSPTGVYLNSTPFLIVFGTPCIRLDSQAETHCCFGIASDVNEGMGNEVEVEVNERTKHAR